MISIEHLRKSFAVGTANAVTALDDISLHIPRGEFVVLLGANGSGKSTLLNAVAGTVIADSGIIRLDGQDVTRLPEHRRSRWVSRIFQNPLSGTAPELTLLENFRLAALRTHRFGLRIGTGAAFRRKVQEDVAALGLQLENKLDQKMGTFSGGQRQALSLLMAVADEAKIILLDEPTAALDPRTATLVMELADRLIREHQLTAILITHQLKDAVRYGDRTLLMSAGKITRDLPREDRKSLTINNLLDWFEV